MQKTSSSSVLPSDKMAWSAEELMANLSCGRATAIKIAEDAGARIKIGRRVLFNVSKIQKYLDSISEV